MEPHHLRAWASGRRLAEQRDLQERVRQNTPIQQRSREGLEVIQLIGEAIGWPVPETPLRLGEDDAARDAWQKLRLHYLSP